MKLERGMKVMTKIVDLSNCKLNERAGVYGNVVKYNYKVSKVI